jgi:hypothetical protein
VEAVLNRRAVVQRAVMQSGTALVVAEVIGGGDERVSRTISHSVSMASGSLFKNLDFLVKYLYGPIHEQKEVDR